MSAGTFQILYFAAASSHSNCDREALPAPMPLSDLYPLLERRHPGFIKKVLQASLVTINLEYVDIGQGDSVVIQPGDEVAIIPPVSAG